MDLLSQVLSIPGILLLLVAFLIVKSFQPKKVKSLSQNTVILITGGVQGLGKQLANCFARAHKEQITLILIDIREDLASQTLREIKQEAGIKSIEYYNCDISDSSKLNETWDLIIKKHQKVNILVNNAARTLGRRVRQLSFEDIRKTMEINFLSIVQLSKLFLDQRMLVESKVFDDFHLVNINSIGSQITSVQNSDYSASKFALHGFTDSLRQEIEEEFPGLCMTNIYPYFINTGLYEGLKPLARILLPMLDQTETAEKIYSAIMNNKKEVYIWWFIVYLRIVMDLLPLRLRNWMIQVLMGNGMKTFVGRQQGPIEVQQSKKDL